MAAFVRRITVTHPTTGEVRTFDVTAATPAKKIADLVMGSTTDPYPWTLQSTSAGDAILPGAAAIVAQTPLGDTDFVIALEPPV